MNEMQDITLTPYTTEASGKLAYRAETPIGSYCVQNHGPRGWAAVQLFGMMLIAAYGDTPENAVQNAVDLGPDPIETITI